MPRLKKVTGKENKILLNTRPENCAEETSERLRRAGFSVMESPVLRILSNQDVSCRFIEELETAKAVIFSSLQAPLALKRHVPDLKTDKPLRVIGETAAAYAKEAGFHGAVDIFKNAEELARSLTASPAGEILYGAGKNRKPEIERAFKNAEINYRLLELYEARPYENLTEITIQGVKTGELKKILLFSSRSAKIFSRLLHKTPELADRKESLEIYAVGRKKINLFPNEMNFPDPESLFHFFSA